MAYYACLELAAADAALPSVTCGKGKSHARSRRERAACGGRIEARGPGHHGDLMTAVALALWWQGIGRL